MLHENIYVSIIIPIYGEADNLRNFVEQICISTSKSNLSNKYEIIVVCDSSNDGSKNIVSELANEGKPIRIIERMEERGLGSTVLRGFQEANGKILICMATNLSHPPQAMTSLVSALEIEDCDFVIGSRHIKGGGTGKKQGPFRWLSSKAAALLAKLFTSVKDPISGVFGLRKENFLAASKLTPSSNHIGLELLVKLNCKNITEIPIHFSDRKFGQSKFSLKEQVNYIRHIKRLFDFKYGKFSRFCQFCMVGLSGMVWDLSIYITLMALSVYAPAARAAAIFFAITWNFWLNRRITFSYSRIHAVEKQYLCFIGSSSLGAIISWSISIGLLEWVPFFRQDFNYLIAAILGIFAGTVSNFTISHNIVFKKERSSHDNQNNSERHP